MSVANNLKLVLEVTTALDSHKVYTWLFGGWAEELQGIISPRIHKDIDLLYPAPNFDILDKLLLSDVLEIREIKAKHFIHKRAFLYHGIMIEVILLQKDNSQYFTNFFGQKIFYWPKDSLEELNFQKQKIRIASVETLQLYRLNHDAYAYELLNS